jgi:acetyl esterase
MIYDSEIDKETWAFIEKTKSFYSDELLSYSIEQQRLEYNQMCRAFDTHRQYKLIIKTEEWDTIPVRIYEPQNSMGTLIYFHGGGFVVGDLDSHHDVCANLAEKSQLRVVSVAYSLAPEHKHPAQFNDAYHAVKIASNTYPEPLIVAGDSAGGNLAACVCHSLRSTDINLSGQVLIYPSLGTNMDSKSFIIHSNAPLLSTKDMLYYKKIRCENDVPEDDATFAPLNDEDFSNLPPTIVFTAACDPLVDDGEKYCEKITNSGGLAKWINEAGLVHGYLRARSEVARASNSFERIAFAAASLAQKKWPY